MSATNAKVCSMPREPGATPGGVWPEHRWTCEWQARELASPIGHFMQVAS
jgi:hypothetical protein